MNGITAALTGYLGGDADQRFTANGSPMLTFSIGVDRKDESQPAEWLKVTIFGDQVDDLAPRLVKGVHVYCEGRLRLNTWTGQDGTERSGLQLTAWTVQPMGQIGRRRPQGSGRVGVPAGVGRAMREDDDDSLPF